MPRFLILIAAIGVAAPAMAQQASPTAAPAAPSAAPAPTHAPAKSDRVCRKMTVTGRRIADTYCYSAAQWAQIDSRGSAGAQDLLSGVSAVAARGGLGEDRSGGLDTSTMFGMGPH